MNMSQLRETCSASGKIILVLSLSLIVACSEGTSTPDAGSSQTSDAEITKEAAPDSNQEVPTEATPAANTSLITTSAIVLLGAALLLSSGIAVFLLRWRREERDGQISIVPIRLLDQLKRQESALKQHADKISSHLNLTRDHIDKQNQRLDEIMHSYTAMQNALDLRDHEIKRLREGYEAGLVKNTLRRFARLHRELDLEIQEADSEDARNRLSGIRDLLMDRLEESGVEAFSPLPGESIRNAFGVDDSYTEVPTDDPDLDHTIARVINPGLRTGGVEDPTCLVKASVAVYIKTKHVGVTTDG